MIRNEKYLVDLVKYLIKYKKETEWLEFKTNYYQAEEIGKYISALSNSATLCGKPFAYMIWGIDDETHEIVGTNFDVTKKKVGNEEFENWLHRMMNPKINFTFYSIKIDDKNVVILEIPKAEYTVSKFKNESYVRIGSSKRSINDMPLKEKELWKYLNSTPFEDSISLENVSSDDVLQKLDYSSYFSLLNIPHPDNREGILHYLMQDNLIQKENTGNWGITNLGAILFARNIDEFKSIKRKGIRVIEYKGQSKLETIREQIGKKGYAIGFENLINFVDTIIPRNEVIGKALRKDVPMYPELAIRELIANSVVHQDFTISGTGPMIEIYTDRIEITNPGIPLVEIDRFLDNPPKSRNEQLASFLRRIGVCEERGSGFDKVVAKTEEFQLPAPKIEVYKEHIKVTLFAHIPYSKMTKEDKLRACYLHSCLKYVNNDYLTNTSLRERFGIDQKNNAMISRIIKSTIDEKLIKPYEEDTAPRYMKYVPYWA